MGVTRLMNQEEVGEELERFLNLPHLSPELKATVTLMRLLYEIYLDDPELFFNLAVVGVKPDAPQGMKNLAVLAHRLQRINLGCEVLEIAHAKGQIRIFGGKTPSEVTDVIDFDGVVVQHVRMMLCELAIGRDPTDPTRAKVLRMKGGLVSEARLRFCSLDTPEDDGVPHTIGVGEIRKRA